MILVTEFFSPESPVFVYQSKVPQNFQTPAFVIYVADYHKQKLFMNYNEVWATISIIYFDDWEGRIPGLLLESTYDSLIGIGDKVNETLFELPYYEFDTVERTQVCTLNGLNIRSHINPVGIDGHNSNANVQVLVDFHFFVYDNISRNKMNKLTEKINVHNEG